MSGKLTASGLNLEAYQVENLGGILQCFGEIDNDNTWGERVPPETDEQRKAKMLLEIKKQDKIKAEQAAKQTKKIEKTPEELEKQRKEEAEDKKREEELIAQMKPSKPIKVMLNLTSLHDLLNCLNRMGEFDRMLTDL